jgi:hypothetical protein
VPTPNAAAILCMPASPASRAARMAASVALSIFGRPSFPKVMKRLQPGGRAGSCSPFALGDLKRSLKETAGLKGRPVVLLY